MGIFKEQAPTLGKPGYRWVDRDWWQATKLWVGERAMPVSCHLFGHDYSDIGAGNLSGGGAEICQRRFCVFARFWYEGYSYQRIGGEEIRMCPGGFKYYWPFQYKTKAEPQCPHCNRINNEQTES